MAKKEAKHGATRRKRATGVREARPRYIVDGDQREPAIYTGVKLSAKNQITLPVAAVRALSLRPGDELDFLCFGGVIYLEKSLTGDVQLDRLEGSMAHVPEWSTKERIDAWIRQGRDDNRDY